MSRDFARSSIEILLLNLKNLDLLHCASYSGTPKDTRAFRRDGYWHLENLNRSEIIVQSLPYGFVLLCIKNNNMQERFDKTGQ